MGSKAFGVFLLLAGLRTEGALPSDSAIRKILTLRLRPEGRREFFVSELPLRVTFDMDGAGQVSGILIYPPRGQKAVPATRVK